MSVEATLKLRAGIDADRAGDDIGEMDEEPNKEARGKAIKQGRIR